MKYRRILATVLPLVIAGCVAPGGMIPGSIYSEKGQILDFAIEKAHRSGSVTAYNKKTNESFSGTYVGILEEFNSFSSGVAFSGRASATSFNNTSISSNIGNAQAILQGDKGSSMTCKMKVEVGLSPHGIGVCQDNKGINYRLQF